MFSKFAGITVSRIGKDDFSGNFASSCALDHFQSQLDLGLERGSFRDASHLATLGIVDPALRQVQLEIEREMLGTGCDRQADCDLTIGDLARRTRVLALDADRLFALLEKAGVGGPRMRGEPASLRRACDWRAERCFEFANQG